MQPQILRTQYSGFCVKTPSKDICGIDTACNNELVANAALINNEVDNSSPEGFGPRWHPPREKEKFCAQGNMLFLSLYEATLRQSTRKELYDRCHEMIDLGMDSPYTNN